MDTACASAGPSGGWGGLLCPRLSQKNGNVVAHHDAAPILLTDVDVDVKPRFQPIEEVLRDAMGLEIIMECLDPLYGNGRSDMGPLQSLRFHVQL